MANRGEDMQIFSNIVILCVGSSKIVGDSLGPIVGQKLTRLLENKKEIAIYGNMLETLNLKNATKIIEQINKKYELPFIIVVDAALGKKEFIENIIINTGKICIGSAGEKCIECESHIYIKGIVGEYKNNLEQNRITLLNVKRNRIQKLANQITYEIYKLTEKIKYV